MKVAAIVANRVHVAPPPELWDELTHLAGPLRGQLEKTLAEAEQLARQDELGVERLRQMGGETPVVQVPRFDEEVHDLGALYEASRWLWDDLGLGQRKAISR
jgi:hypothetical protein